MQQAQDDHCFILDTIDEDERRIRHRKFARARDAAHTRAVRVGGQAPRGRNDRVTDPNCGFTVGFGKSINLAGAISPCFWKPDDRHGIIGCHGV